MCNVSLGKHNLSTKSEKHLFQSVVLYVVYFLSSSGNALWSMQRASFPTPGLWLWLVVGFIASGSVLVIAVVSGEWFTFPLSGAFDPVQVMAGARGLKQLNKDKSKFSSVQAVGAAVVQGCAGRLCSTIWTSFLTKSSQYQEYGDFSAPLLLKPPLFSPFITGCNFIKIPLALNICASCLSCVLFLPHLLFPAFPLTAWGLFLWLCSWKLLLVLLKNSCTVEKKCWRDWLRSCKLAGNMWAAQA